MHANENAGSKFAASGPFRIFPGSTREGNESPQWRRQGRGEGLEVIMLLRIETRFGGGGGVHKRQQRINGLGDGRPFQGALVTVVVGRGAALSHALRAGDGFNRAAVFFGNVRSQHARQSAVIALDAHDARRGDAQVRGAEIPHTHEVGGDESVFQRNERIQGGLGILEHPERIIKGRVGSRRAGDRFLQRVMRHFLFAGGDEVTLVIRGQAAKEGRVIDDVGVGGHGERLGDFGGGEDVNISRLQAAGGGRGGSGRRAFQERGERKQRRAGYGGAS